MKEKSATFQASAIMLGVIGLAGFSAAVQAQSGPPGGGAQTPSVQLYGYVDLGVGKLQSQPNGPPNVPITSVTGVHNSGSPSYFGFRGTESLGGGLRAQFQLEGFFRADTGASGRFNPPGPPQDPFFSRSAWVGLAGGFGDVKLGNVSNPAFVSMLFSSALGGNALFSPVHRQQYNGAARGYSNLDSILPNSLSYTTPRFGGVSGTVVVQASEGSGSGNNVVANAVYRSGPIVLTAAIADSNHVGPPDPAAVADERMFVVGGSYDLKAVKLFAQFTSHKEGISGTTIKTPHLGLTVPIGVGQVQAAWARSKTERGNAASNRTTIGLGYLHPLSKRTSLYGFAGSDKVPVGTATSYLVGVRHSF